MSLPETPPPAARSAERTGPAAGVVRSRTSAALALLALAGAAGALAWIAGRRGLFAFDQSILFDGGWRVLAGQVPFRDFVAPVGPVPFWLQGAAFALFGVGWTGYLATAVGLAAASVGAAFLAARPLLPGHRAFALLAAALTGAWLVPPSGTPWMDQVAFLLVLLALWAWVSALGAGGRPVDGAEGEAAPEGPPPVARRSLAALAGALLVGAFLSKQNAALAALPALAAPALAAPLLAWWSRPGPASSRPRREVAGESGQVLRSAGWLAVGAAAASLLFAAWLVAFAEPRLFVEHFLRLPADLGGLRLVDDPGRLALTLLSGAGSLPLRLLLMLCAVPAAVELAGLVLARRRPRRPRPSLPAVRAALLVPALLLAQNLFLATSNNQPEIALPWTGLGVALGGWLAWRSVGEVGGAGSGRPRRALRATVLVGVAAVSTALAVSGVRVALSRGVHDAFPPGTRFERALGVEGLTRLVWGEPTLLEDRAGPTVGTAAVEGDHVVRLLERLRRRSEPFFVFPDWTLLYGLTEQPSPQPLLWFHPGLTYPSGGDPDLDRRIVAELERHGVTAVVLEEASWLGAERLEDFPHLRRWIGRCFQEEERFGPFRLLVRHERCGAAGEAGPRSAGGQASGGGAQPVGQGG